MGVYRPRSFLETAWRGVAAIYTGETPPAAEKIRRYAASLGVPVHYLTNKDVERAFRCYDAVIFVEALGGVVRLICPHLRDKEADPPVLVVDREGRYFVPLVGAHRGANKLAEELAVALGGAAVVTTAVEAAGAAPPEELEKMLLCRMTREERLRVAAALRDGKEICVADVEAAPPGYKSGRNCGLTIRRDHSCGEGEICCRPLRLYVGLGLTSAAAPEEAAEAVRKVLEDLGADLSTVAALASVKPAALEVAKRLGVPAVVYRLEELKVDWDCLSPPSPKALEALGIPGAAEPAALTAAGPGASLIYRKRVLGRVTVAVAAAP
jgi:Cobalamin biosynthesis protein CbiG